MLRRSEARVMDELVLGKNNLEIAEALGLSVKTIDSHLTRIKEITGIYSRVLLAFWWRDNTGNLG